MVECDLASEASGESIVAAIGNASRVVVAIGASESDLGDVSGPYRVDAQAVIATVKAAKKAGHVQHFVLVSSLGTGKVGFPAAVLNLFFGVLVWKRQAEIALESSGLNYTIVRPGGMERPTDEYKATHNVRLSPADTLFGGQISRLQVAELIAAAILHPEVASNKIAEAVAETTAPWLPYEDLLKALPSDKPPSAPPRASAPAAPVSKSPGPRSLPTCEKSKTDPRAACPFPNALP